MMSAPPRPDRSAAPRLTSYEDERATYRIEMPETYNPVIDIVERWAHESPDDVALVSLDGGGAVVAEQTAADLARESRRAARALIELGVKPGDRVFIMLPRVPAWYARDARGDPDWRRGDAGHQSVDAEGHRLPDRKRRRRRGDHRW